MISIEGVTGHPAPSSLEITEQKESEGIPRR